MNRKPSLHHVYLASDSERYITIVGALLKRSSTPEFIRPRAPRIWAKIGQMGVSENRGNLLGSFLYGHPTVWGGGGGSILGVPPSYTHCPKPRAYGLPNGSSVPAFFCVAQILRKRNEMNGTTYKSSGQSPKPQTHTNPNCWS